MFKVLFAEINANVVFVVSCLYSAMSLTLVRDQHCIRIISSSYYYYYLLPD